MRALPRTVLVAVTLLTVPAAALAGRRCRDVADGATLGAPGPYPVGQRTVTYVDPSRPTPPNGTFPGAPSRTLVTELWYPSLPGSAGGAFIDPSGAPYPVVVHSHGFLDSRTGETYYTRHLASHGYVVASMDYPLSHGGSPGGPTVKDVGNQPGDIRFLLDRLLVDLSGSIDPDRIGLSGYSLGGMTTLLATYHRELRDPRIKAALGIAPVACMFTRRFYGAAHVPLLVLQGDQDVLLPFAAHGLTAYRSTRGPAHLIAPHGGTHTGFSQFAPFFDQSQHHDRIGCAALLGALPPGDENPFPPLGDERIGVDASRARCPDPCKGPFVEPPMPALRMAEVLRTTGAAFFDAYLKGDTAARCWLHQAKNGNPDLTVRSR
jgi:predicted dienelactone hydrolase